MVGGAHPTKMFRIKICGITTVEDALAVAEAGADAIGLNFYPKSPRYVTPETARRIADCLPRGIIKVGLFVNSPADEIARIFGQTGLDLIQLHGDEAPSVLGGLAGRPVMRAFRVGEAGLRPVLDYLDQCRGLGCLPELCLLDAFQQGHYGGTGVTADWSLVGDYPRDGAYPPLVLAGGLRPENVAEAIRQVQPVAVDTASGVERVPGRKDPKLVARFVQAALSAMQPG